MNSFVVSPEAFSYEERIPSHVDQLVQVEPLLEQIAKRAGLSEERTPLFIVAITEAIANAILHGNRQDASKQVWLRFSYDPAQRLLVVEVEDEGVGFDPTTLPDPTVEENLLRESGRGIFLMRNLADAVEYKKGGRCVELRFVL